MTLLCTVTGHAAQTIHHHNQGLDFCLCHHCGCDLVRAEDGDWTEVPKGFRVVWREFGRAGDAASVAARMARMAPPPRRRDPRNGRPKPRRDPRGTPLKGAASMFGALSGLGKLLSNGEPVEDNEGRPMETSGQYVICLPGAG
jgi:hypothetical protein